MGYLLLGAQVVLGDTRRIGYAARDGTALDVVAAEKVVGALVGAASGGSSSRCVDLAREPSMLRPIQATGLQRRALRGCRSRRRKSRWGSGGPGRRRA
jgi:hypothetical protein